MCLYALTDGVEMMADGQKCGSNRKRVRACALLPTGGYKSSKGSEPGTGVGSQIFARGNLEGGVSRQTNRNLTFTAFGFEATPRVPHRAGDRDGLHGSYAMAVYLKKIDAALS